MYICCTGLAPLPQMTNYVLVQIQLQANPGTAEPVTGSFALTQIITSY